MNKDTCDAEASRIWPQDAEYFAFEEGAGRAKAATVEEEVGCCFRDVAGGTVRLPADVKLDQDGLEGETVREGAANHVGLLPVQCGEEFDDLARGIADVQAEGVEEGGLQVTGFGREFAGPSLAQLLFYRRFEC